MWKAISTKAKSLLSRSKKDDQDTEKIEFFSDYYQTGDKLGEGAFGVVLNCRKIVKRKNIDSGPSASLTNNADVQLGDEVYAVKLVDKIESPIEMIWREVKIMRALDHPNILKMHRAINDQCFICIVLDLVKGGDMMEAMINHWDSNGQIPFEATTRVVRQILSGMAYMHEAKIIHRDMKCDNVLCDLPNIADPNERMRIADFGTALKLTKANARLTELCGTKQYWSPEFYRSNYSFPVDVWAIGVCVWGLLMSSWPFGSKQDVFSKVLRFDKKYNVPELHKELVWAMVNREEKVRPTFSDLLDHPLFLGKGTDESKKLEVGFVASHDLVEPSGVNQGRMMRSASAVMSAQLSDSADERFAVFEGDIAAKNGPDLGIQNRRKELVGRMNERERPGKKGVKIQPSHFRNDFNLLDKPSNSVFRYEWWSEVKAAKTLSEVEEPTMDPTSTGCSSLDSGIILEVAAQENAQVPVIARMLQKHGVNVKSFGQGRANTLQKLVNELETGKSVLMLDAGNHHKLVRVVELVCLRIYSPRGQYLIDCGEALKDGREIVFHRLPGLKKLPYENSRETANRLLQQMGQAVDKVEIDWDSSEMFEEEELSRGYPGLFTVYRKEIFNCAAGSGSGAKPIRWSEAYQVDMTPFDENVNSRSFKWMTPAKCKSAGVTLKAPANQQERSECLVEGDIGMNAKDLRKFFQSCKVDVSKFGKDNAKSIEDIAEELQKGECSLATGDDGGIVRIVDVVLLKLRDPINGLVLIQAQRSFPDGKVTKMERLPGMKRRPDESPFITARKIVNKQLKIPENCITINPAKVAMKEEVTESLAYPGLPTVYRKRLITADLEQAPTPDPAASAGFLKSPDPDPTASQSSLRSVRSAASPAPKGKVKKAKSPGGADERRKSGTPKKRFVRKSPAQAQA